MIWTAVIVISIMLTIGFSLGLHVATTLGLTALVVGLTLVGPVWDFFGAIPWATTSSVTIAVVPLFVLMGELMLRAGLTDDLYATLSRFMNKVPGGLLHTNILSCTMFSAISGSSLATATTIGSVALPVMKERGYNERLALGSIAAGGTLGILIPPSLILIVYGLVAEVSIAKLYVATLLPGLLMVIFFMLAIAVISKYSKTDSDAPAETYTLREKLSGLVDIIPVAALLTLIIGVIYGGVATPTEAAAFGATGAFLIALFKGRVSMAMLQETFLATSTTTAMLMFVLAAAFLLQFILGFVGLPRALSQWVLSFGLTQLQLILMMCLVFILLGMVLDSLPIVVAVVPIFLPLLEAQGIDLIWFGVLLVILIELGLITPPIGMNIFVLQGVRRRLYGEDNCGTMTDIFLGVLPFVVAMLVVLGLVIAFPGFSLWAVEAMR
ncbi:TRAP transporter large permease [Pararhodobacter oceanensis]|uniref:TRAP transporter large permease n=1 Tax=Pararhodobacter oceanensis TaxID=2172121 RepID=UPI003A919096